MIIAAFFFGGSAALFALVLIFDCKAAKPQKPGQVIPFPKRGRFVDLRV